MPVLLATRQNFARGGLLPHSHRFGQIVFRRAKRRMLGNGRIKEQKFSGTRPKQTLPEGRQTLDLCAALLRGRKLRPEGTFRAAVESRPARPWKAAAASAGTPSGYPIFRINYGRTRQGTGLRSNGVPKIASSQTRNGHPQAISNINETFFPTLPGWRAIPLLPPEAR